VVYIPLVGWLAGRYPCDEIKGIMMISGKVFKIIHPSTYSNYKITRTFSRIGLERKVRRRITQPRV
jgi:hypothetical protein